MSGELYALRYLVPDEESFWEWKDEGDVVAFRGGGTLAFREQLLTALKSFADRSLPPLELVLLVLAACRDSWPEERKALESQDSPLAKTARPFLKLWRATVFEALDRVQSMPQQIRSNPAAVAMMVEIALERFQRTSDVIVDVFSILSRPHWMRLWVLPEPLLLPFGERTHGYAALSRGLLDLTVDEVLTRTSTGLNQLPVMDRLMGQLQQLILNKEVEEVRTVRQFLDELQDDEEFRGLIRVVRMLSAVLTLPRSLSTPEELPQGGVSDISNRGPLDRLLLSELANDDDTLMTRVALNEALYIRRETPPAHPVRERVLLIDTGIRMWGLPRLCAAAVGLCLAAQESSQGEVRVYRSSQDGVQPVDFTTRQGLTEHLAALDCLAHPGEVLAEWVAATASFFSEKGRTFAEKSAFTRRAVSREGEALAEPRSRHHVPPHLRLGGSLALPGTGRSFAERKVTLPATTDRILITGEDVLADSEFRRHLRASEVIPAFVVTVNREGRVRLIRLTAIGEKVLRELWLDIDALSGSETRPEKSLVDKSSENQLPAILRLKQLPLRMPYSLHEPEVLALYPRVIGELADLLQITKDRRLLLWDQAHRGGRQITDRMPRGQLRWSGDLLNDRTFSMVLTRQDGHVELVHLTPNAMGECECDCIAMNFLKREDGAPHVYAVVADKAVLLLILKKSIVAVWPVTGDRLASSRFPANMRWVRDRFFIHEGTYFTVSYTGGQFQFDKFFAPFEHGIIQSLVLGIVGPPGDLVAILVTGDLVNINSMVKRRVVDSMSWIHCHLSAVSSDGKRFVVSTVRGRVASIGHTYVTLGVPDQVKQSFYPLPLMLYDCKGGPTDEAIFRQPLCLAYGRHLMIVTKKGRRLLIDTRPEKNSVMYLRDYAQGDDSLYHNTPPFVEIPSPPGVGYTLKQVTWEDGSRAVLDSRGMLHLQSSDREIPEMTLVLNEKHISGWCSTGEVWGRDYFIDEQAGCTRLTSSERPMQYLRRFLERLP